MHASEQVKAFIRSYESFRAMPYKDAGDKSTVGYGHLITPQDADYSAGITQSDALDLFSADLNSKAEEPVAASIEVDVSPQEFDAMVSLCYNIGAGNFSGSHLVQYLNSGKPAQVIANEFLKWDHVEGVVSEGLYERRVAERDIFLSGIYKNHS